MAFACIRCQSEINPDFKACPFCGEVITDFLRRHYDSPIDGKYRIVSRLGAGGMGEVYKVVHVHLNTTRVVKLMRPAIADDRDSHDRFLREARMATLIQHPNVATLFDFSDLQDGSFYMVWEYIDGTNLHDLIQQSGPVSPRHAATLAVQALRGLEAIHRAGIIHRDISPENIMVTRDDDGERIKIIDLGIAKRWAEEDSEKTKTGVFVGKWKYCSPEHLGILKENERIDARADLYSFGIVLYEMLTGVPPFQATTPHGFLVMHSSETPPPLREINPTVSASSELEKIIFRALEKDRTRRFGSAREFAQALEPLMLDLDDTGARPIRRKAERTREVPPEKPSTERTLSIDHGATLSTVPADTLPANLTVPVETMPGRDTLRLDAAGTVELSHGPDFSRPATISGVRIGWPRLIAAAAGAIVVAVIAGSLLISRPEPAPLAAPAPVAAKPEAAPGSLAVNAFPWGEVRSIRNLTRGVAVPLKEPLITPAPIELAPGKYEITLSNPAFASPILRVVDLRAGEHQRLSVQFIDPASATLPQFGVRQ